MATKKDLSKIKKVLSNTDVEEACTGERGNTQWNFYKLTKITVFDAPLKKNLRWVFRLGIAWTTEKTTQTIFFHWTGVEENSTATTYVHLDLRFCISTEMGTWEMSFKIVQFLHSENRWNWSSKSSASFCLNDIPATEDVVQINKLL